MALATATGRHLIFTDDPLSPGQSIQLRASRCSSCHRTEFPARGICPACAAQSVQVELSGRGRLVGFSAVLHAPPGALVEVPYWIGVTQFDEAVSILGLIEGPGEGLVIGDEVECIVLCPAEGLTTYGFRLAPTT
jgi:uncharacterized OB-fold protein